MPRSLALPSFVSAALLLAEGCNGKPEDASAYTAAPPAAAGPSTVEVKTPAPPPPPWAVALIGKSLKDISKGAAVCTGVLDAVTRRHTGPRPGSEIEGWGWDQRGARPLDRVLFTDVAGKVVGGATVGDLRPDVPKAIPEVKTPKVGWRGVAEVTTDEVRAVGVTPEGDTCAIGQTILG